MRGNPRPAEPGDHDQDALQSCAGQFRIVGTTEVFADSSDASAGIYMYSGGFEAEIVECRARTVGVPGNPIYLETPSAWTDWMLEDEQLPIPPVPTGLVLTQDESFRPPRVVYQLSWEGPTDEGLDLEIAVYSYETEIESGFTIASLDAGALLEAYNGAIRVRARAQVNSLGEGVWNPRLSDWCNWVGDLPT